MDNFFLLPYYSEKGRKIQAFCPDFAKQTNFSSGDNPVDKAVERIVPSVEKGKNICSRAGRPAWRKGQLREIAEVIPKKTWIGEKVCPEIPAGG